MYLSTELNYIYLKYQCLLFKIYYKSLIQQQNNMSNKNQQVVTFSTDDYLIPQSSALPKYQFFFQVIKDGSIIGKVNIKKKEFNLIGRIDDLCDIFIDNPTVSRKHAILQFHKQDPLPSIYDLSSAQGTFVNKQKLPPYAYKKLQLFSNIKFGVSSRYYLLRCPQLEQKQNQQEEQRQNEFIKTLNQQNKMLSKQQAKVKYLQLLENDPYFGGQLKSRRFQGEKKSQINGGIQNNQQEGITWGIGDESEVYAYKNQREFPIEPDVIRRLPGLDQPTLQRIAQYEQKFRIYDEIQSELNQLSNKQKREYGLQEKLQGRKQRLQKKFLQSLQALQKCEDWIRTNIFGQESMAQLDKKKKKEKQKDTFSDDEFYDRTLEDKRQKKDEKTTKKDTQKLTVEENTVEDLWMLKNSFIHQLSRKKQLITQSQTTQKKQQGDAQQLIEEEVDELEIYMKQNEENLEQQNKNIYAREIDLVEEKLKELKQKLLRFLNEREIAKIEEEIVNPEKIKEKQDRKRIKQAQQRENLSKTLQRIEAQERARRQKEERKRKLEQECTDEYSQKIFDLYKQVQEQEEYGQDDDQRSYKRPLYNNNLTEDVPQDHPSKRVHTINPQQFQTQQQEHNDKLQEDHVVDLTKNFK